MKTRIPSDGGLKEYLENFERAEMIRSFIPLTAAQIPNSENRRCYTSKGHNLRFFSGHEHQ
jgi:hypothetical protein